MATPTHLVLPPSLSSSLLSTSAHPSSHSSSCLLFNTPNWVQAQAVAFADASAWNVLYHTVLGYLFTFHVSTQISLFLDRPSQTILGKAVSTSPVAVTHRPELMFLLALTSTCHHVAVPFVCILTAPTRTKAPEGWCCLVHCFIPCTWSRA